MNACSMVNTCLARQQGEQADVGGARQEEDVRTRDFLPATDLGIDGAYRNLDTETPWSG